MGKIHRITDYLQESNRFSIYSSVFRVYLGFHVIKKIYLSWGSISLITGDMLDAKVQLPAFLKFLTDILISDVPVVYYIGILISFLYMFGIGRIYVAIVFHLLCRLLSEINYLYSNGGDNILLFVSLYMIFVDSYNHLALNPTEKKSNTLTNYLSNLGAYAIMIHLCVIYFVSSMHKIHADVWFNGVATYYIMNLERYNSPINQYFFKNGFVIGLTTYFTIAFELLFPILVWNKNLRKICLVAGLFMHLGIYFTMMIYDFEILFIMTYGFFVSELAWERFIARFLYKPIAKYELFNIAKQPAHSSYAAG
jgi:hypothetical protein